MPVNMPPFVAPHSEPPSFQEQLEAARVRCGLGPEATAWQIMNANADRQRTETDAFCDLARIFGFDVVPRY